MDNVKIWSVTVYDYRDGQKVSMVYDNIGLQEADYKALIELNIKAGRTVEIVITPKSGFGRLD